MAKQIKVIPTPDFSQKLSASLLGHAIKARRTQSHMKLIEAAALCGVSKQTLNNIEKGHDSTQLKTILRVCHNLGITLNIQPWVIEVEEDEWL